jgi:hypothetical protein
MMKSKSIVLFFMMSFIAALLGCSQSKSVKVVEGGFYSLQNENGSYSVLKVLKVDDGGVHVRVYSNQFPSQPAKIDENSLYMAGADHKPNETLGMGHAPLSKKSFEAWQTTFVQQSAVKENELEGYKMWLEAKGGYF